MPQTPDYASVWELVEDNTDYEYRNFTTVILGAGLVIDTQQQRRKIRSKTYAASIKDGNNEIPAPDYLAGLNSIEANPENLSPVGTADNQWHCDNISYTKELSVPLSRNVRVTWVINGVWENIEDQSTSN